MMGEKMARPRIYPCEPSRDLKMLAWWCVCRAPLDLDDAAALEAARVHCKMTLERLAELRDTHAAWLAAHDLPARRARRRSGEAPRVQAAALRIYRKGGKVKARAKAQRPRPRFYQWLWQKSDKVARIASPDRRLAATISLLMESITSRDPDFLPAELTAPLIDYNRGKLDPEQRRELVRGAREMME